MVCIYCGGKTAVVNSRAQKRSNQVWRRRSCLNCQALFSSTEMPNLTGSLRVTNKNGHLEPFSRDKLFISIYFACGHLKNALNSSTELTATTIAKLLGRAGSAILKTSDIEVVALETLKHFDKTAALSYEAYHHIAA